MARGKFPAPGEGEDPNPVIPVRHLAEPGTGLGLGARRFRGGELTRRDGKARGEAVISLLGFRRPGSKSKGSGQCPVPSLHGLRRAAMPAPCGTHGPWVTAVPVHPRLRAGQRCKDAIIHTSKSPAAPSCTNGPGAFWSSKETQGTTNLRRGHAPRQGGRFPGSAHRLDVREVQLLVGKGHLSNGCRCHVEIQGGLSRHTGLLQALSCFPFPLFSQATKTDSSSD